LSSEDQGDGVQVNRREELSRNLDLVHARIAAACRACGRSPDQVKLVVVTKTFPASDVALLAELGCTDVAENKDQEARAKAAAVPEGTPLRWHMIGQLQRNKAKSVAAWADVVESVDRPELAQALAASASAQGRVLDVLIQVCLDPTPVPGRGGVSLAQAEELARVCRGLPGLRLAGVMGVAPHPGDPVAAFALLASVRDRLAELDPGCRQMSAGMSEDLEEAIGAGATQVRIGGAVLGNRAMLK
jgi:pyridoxal phosphate enzyme (YggS family)